ncbi:MAG: hypothetical protein QM765_29200 [Myxococcales bacterium]
MKTIAMLKLLSLVLAGSLSMDAVSFWRDGGKVVGELGVTVPQGWQVQFDRTRFAKKDLGAGLWHPGEVLELPARAGGAG